MLKYRIITVIIILFFINLSINSMVTAEQKISLNIEKQNFDNIIIVDKSKGDYKKIQNAIDAANPGDTVQVLGGMYNESLNLNKTIKLIGEKSENGEKPIINGCELENTILISAEDCVVEGFNITNSNKTTPYNGIYNSGIKIYSDNTIIRNNTIFDNKNGIYLYKSGNCKILNNVVKAVNLIENIEKRIENYGIFLLESSKNLISNNKFIDIQNAIQVNFQSNNNNISGNYIFCRRGIEVKTSTNNKIMDNIIKGAYVQYSISLPDLNYEYSYPSIGIKLFSSCNCSIVNNYISGEYFGFRVGIYLVKASNKNIVEKNTIRNIMEYGLFIKEYSNKNLISYNNFINNTYNISDIPCHISGIVFKITYIFNKYGHAYFRNSYFNSWKHNYWDNWDKKILPKPIKGKIGKRLVLAFPMRNFDWNPAKKPITI